MLLVAASLASSGCAAIPAILSGLQAVSQLGQVIGSALDVADDGSKAFFARHPNLDSQQVVGRSLLAARRALAAYDAAAATVEALDAEKLPEAKAEALKSFGEIRALLQELGILDATPPPGGVESDAPEPDPFELPTVAELEAMS